MHAVALQVWAGSVSAAQLTEKCVVIAIMRAACDVARKAHMYDDSTARNSWMSWLQEGPAGGLGRQHRMSRCATGWIPAKLGPVAATGGDEGALVDATDSPAA